MTRRGWCHALQRRRVSCLTLRARVEQHKTRGNYTQDISGHQSSSRPLSLIQRRERQQNILPAFITGGLPPRVRTLVPFPRQGLNPGLGSLGAVYLHSVSVSCRSVAGCRNLNVPEMRTRERLLFLSRWPPFQHAKGGERESRGG